MHGSWGSVVQGRSPALPKVKAFRKTWTALVPTDFVFAEDAPYSNINSMDFLPICGIDAVICLQLFA